MTVDVAQGSSREPVIVGFLCAWCAYLAADAAGTARAGHSPSMRPIRVMCSGRVEPEFVLRALRDGADGVLIAGCRPGACHYGDGNVKALRRFALLQRLLDQFGVERVRVQLVWVGAAEGALFAAAVDRMARQLRALEPLRWSDAVLGDEACGPEGPPRMPRGRTPA